MGTHAMYKKGQSRQSHFFLLCLVSSAILTVVLAQSENEQALLTAADLGNFEEVKQLVIQGTNVNVVDETQTTPLHWAAFRGHADIVDFLIENGALVNTIDEGGFSPLDSSAEMDHIKVARSLINAGATINVRNTEGRTPLYAAASEGSLAVVRLLLGAGSIVDARYPATDGTPLIIAAALGFPNIVKQLIQFNADWNTTSRRGDFAVFSAAQHGNNEVVQILLEAGLNVDRAKNDGSTSLMIAAQNGHVAIVNMLLANGANPDISNDFGDTALHKAPIRVDDPQLILALVEKGADVDSADNRGDTPLHMAAQFGAIESVRALVDAGANPLLPNFDLELPEEVICECLDFVIYPSSLQCPEGSCSVAAIEGIRRLLNQDTSPSASDGGLDNDIAGTPNAEDEVVSAPN